MTKDSQAPRNVVIVGAGVIGASTAYYLALRGVRAVVVERVGVACAASGRAGGFLARTWCDELGYGHFTRQSFQLHEEIADTLGEEAIGFRRVTTLQVSTTDVTDESAVFDSRIVAEFPEWINPKLVTDMSALSSQCDTALVDPEALTKSLLRHAEQLVGTEVRIGTVVAVETAKLSSQSNVSVTGVRLSDKSVVPADTVVLAMGPWSAQVSTWFPGAPVISGQRAHSIVFENSPPRSAPQDWLSPHAMFVSHSGFQDEFEFYPRSNNTLYVCGLADDHEFPPSPDLVKPDANSIATLVQLAEQLVPGLPPPAKMQACFLPTSESGKPVIGPLPNVSGVFLSAGHSCWGILNAPATGLAMSELVLDGRTHVDISAFDLG